MNDRPWWSSCTTRQWYRPELSHVLLTENEGSANVLERMGGLIKHKKDKEAAINSFFICGGTNIFCYWNFLSFILSFANISSRNERKNEMSVENSKWKEMRSADVFINIKWKETISRSLFSFFYVATERIVFSFDKCWWRPQTLSFHERWKLSVRKKSMIAWGLISQIDFF